MAGVQVRDELLHLIPPVGSVWTDEPFAPEEAWLQTVLAASLNEVTYRSPSGDSVTVSRLRFFDMFPWRVKELEEVQS